MCFVQKSSQKHIIYLPNYVFAGNILPVWISTRISNVAYIDRQTEWYLVSDIVAYLLVMRVFGLEQENMPGDY